MADDVPENRHVLANQQSIILRGSMDDKLSIFVIIFNGQALNYNHNKNKLCKLTWGNGNPSSVQII